MVFLYILFSLLILYISGRFFLVQLTKIVHKAGGSKKALIIIWSLIFLPGTIIHELSHFFAAILVGARTGKIEVLPEFLGDESDSVTLGSVQTQKLNIIQGVIVGLAPFYVGLGILVFLSAQLSRSYALTDYASLIILGYLFFTIANSFFPSASDLTHVIPAAITLLSFTILIFLAGFRFSFQPSEYVNDLALAINLSLLIGSGINVFLGLVFSTLLRITSRW